MKCVELAPDLFPAKRSDVPNSKAKSARVHFERYADVLNMSFRLEVSRKNDDSRDVEDRLSRKVWSAEQVASLGSEELVHCEENNGIFSAALTAYNKHWKLRTAPDDWWFCVIRRVSLAIDANCNKDAVRKMFVNHEDQKTLTVAVPNATIYDVDYSSFFDQMTNEIARNIKVPKYVDAVTADFTTTTPDTKIVSQVTVMSSLKNYIWFGLDQCICGIPGVEMLGTDEDWAKLNEKLKALREILKPIEDEIELTKEWWSNAEVVFQKLLETYREQPDKEWWDRILHKEGAGGYGQIKGYTGWLVHFAEGTTYRVEHRNLRSGLVSVPLEISHPAGIDVGTLVAGMLGFTVHEDETGSRPSVRPYQGWSLLLPKDSPFRVKAAA